MNSNVPSAKVTAGFLAGTAMAILILVLNQYFLRDNPIDGGLSTMLTTLVSGLASYFTTPSDKDVADKATA